MKGKGFRKLVLEFENFHHAGFYREVDSTNLKLLEWLKTEPERADVIIAATQTKGRGRRENIWFSPKGGLWLSARIPYLDFGKHLSVLNILCGLSCVKACNSIINEVNMSSAKTFLRWPNDLMLLDRKLGGLLIEIKTVGRFVKSIVLGVGINVNQKTLPAQIKKQAISLMIATKKRFSRYDLMLRILKELDMMICGFKEKGTEDMAADWKSVSYEIGRRVEIVTGKGRKTRGEVVGIGRSGELLLIDDNTDTKRIFQGFGLKLLDK